MEFKEFPKIARLNREVVVTEKIDGTNAQVTIVETRDTDGAVYFTGPKCRACGDLFTAPERDCPSPAGSAPLVDCGRGGHMFDQPGLAVYAGSRNRFLTLDRDNFGFARWVNQHGPELLTLGPGTHYGEWWGSGVQRGYGLVNGEKRFSLFNVGRWYDEHGTNGDPSDSPIGDTRRAAPACCYVVPVLAYLPNFTNVNGILEDLKAKGSIAAPGFMKPEGIVAFHSASGTLFKATCEKDEKPKGQA